MVTPVPFAARGGRLDEAGLQRVLKEAHWSPAWAVASAPSRTGPVVRLVSPEPPRYREGRR